MKRLLLLFVLFVSGIGLAQNDKASVDSHVAQKMAELEMQGNLEYFYRMDYCGGNIQSFTLRDGTACTSASTYYAVYIFWKEDDGKMKLQKFDNCGSFIPFPVSFNRIAIKTLENRQALKTEKIMPYTYKEDKVNNDLAGKKLDQSCHKEYKFVFAGQGFEKSFSESDLGEGSKDKNKIVKQNNSLNIVKLDVEISKLVKTLEENGKFFREN